MGGRSLWNWRSLRQNHRQHLPSVQPLRPQSVGLHKIIRGRLERRRTYEWKEDMNKEGWAMSWGHSSHPQPTVLCPVYKSWLLTTSLCEFKPKANISIYGKHHRSTENFGNHRTYNSETSYSSVILFLVPIEENNHCLVFPLTPACLTLKQCLLNSTHIIYLEEKGRGLCLWSK